MALLNEITDGSEVIFTLRVPGGRAAAVRRHLETMLGLLEEKPAELDEQYDPTRFDDLHPRMILMQLRQEKKMTQRELAQKLGTTQVRVSNMEQGIVPISPETAQVLATEFGVSALYFLPRH